MAENLKRLKNGKNRVDEFAKDPKKALFILSGPIVVGMLVQVLYNIIDTAFVGRLGAEAIAALTFSFPVFFVLISLTAGLGAGMSSRIGRQLGMKNKRGAENAAMHGLLLTLIVTVVVFTLGFIFLRPLFVLFGAGSGVIELCIQYTSVILGGFIFMFLAFVIGQIFGAQGDTKTSMMIQVCGIVLNIILDPIFIYVLGYGVQGAAIATVISFTFAFFVALVLLKRRSYLELKWRSFQ